MMISNAMRRPARGCGAALVALGVALAIPVSASAKPQRASHHRSVDVQFAVSSERAIWRPTARGRGRLRLDDVSPRMAMMTHAPRRRAAVVPAHMLSANWRTLFRATRGTTNVVLSGRSGDRRIMVPLRARLASQRDLSSGMRFAVRPLRGPGLQLDRLGHRRLVIEDPTLLIDPTVTDAIKAMWAALVSFFGGDTFDVPDNPTYPDGNGVVHYDGSGVYKGPGNTTITSASVWETLQTQALDAAGEWSGSLDGELEFGGSRYDGLALFDGDFGTITFSSNETDTVRVTNSALFGLTAEGLTLDGADFGGVNMRGLLAGEVEINGSLLQSTDVTGSAWGSAASGAERGAINNSAFVDVDGNVDRTDPSGQPDPYSGTAASVTWTNLDFTAVSFSGVTLPDALVTGTTFQGCGLQNVDFSGATFNGAATPEGSRFQPTFDNSILEDFTLDGATFENVSFRGVDFSGGGVTLDGATLNNVDFTGATGLQSIDWTTVDVEGPVYGLASVASELGLDSDQTQYLRSITFDGIRPAIDPDTGFDVDPVGRYLIDPATGVRLVEFDGELVPVNPRTGEQLEDPQNGHGLTYENGRLYDPQNINEIFEVDYTTGELE